MKKLRGRKEQKIIYLSKFKSLWVIYGCLLFRKKTFNINKHLQSESSTRKYILTVKIYGYLVKEMIFFSIFSDSTRLENQFVENSYRILYLAKNFIKWNNFRNKVLHQCMNFSTFSSFSIMIITFHKYNRHSVSPIVNSKFNIIL